MRRTFLIVSLIFLCAGLHAQERSCPRFTFGAEWGYTGIFYYGYHYNFYAPEGYRVDPRDHSFTYESNGDAYLHAGYNFNHKYTYITFVICMHFLHLRNSLILFSHS